MVGKFQATRQNEKWQLNLLDRSTKPSELDGKPQTYVLATVDVFTRRGYLGPLVYQNPWLPAWWRSHPRSTITPRLVG